MAPLHVPHLNCTAAVVPMESHPVRSPQVLDTAILERVQDKEVVGIGARGDGMECFARGARKATAVEMDRDACALLNTRSRSLRDLPGTNGSTFSVLCNRYQNSSVDGDVFTWWQKEPHLKNGEVLRHLRREQMAGRIRSNAEAVLLFENGYEDDMRSLEKVRAWALSVTQVPFNEMALCKLKQPTQPWLCHRAKGSFHIAVITIANISLRNATQSRSNATKGKQDPCIEPPEGRKWAKRGSHGFMYEGAALPSSLDAQPWASPVAADWCEPPAAPRTFVVLTAAIKAFVNLAKRGLRAQQRNETERRLMYETVVRRWAIGSTLPVVFAENSGADLTSLEAQVPAWRRGQFEFLSVRNPTEKLPPRARPDLGRLEARTIVTALNTSRLLATRCPHDLIYGITGRYFIPRFEHHVHDQCLRGRRSDELPLVTPQNPTWGRNTTKERTRYELETSVTGFAASYARQVFGWAIATPGQRYDYYVHCVIGSELNLGRLVYRMKQDPSLRGRVCDLPSMPIMPVREGSTGKYRESL